MAFFNLTDIKIKDPDKNFQVGDILPSKYQSNVLRYPSDIGVLDKGHYMVIHINQQINTFFKREVAEDLPTIFENQNNTGNRSGGSIATQSLAQVLLDLSKSKGVSAAIEYANEIVQKAGVLSTEYAGVSEETVKSILNTVGKLSEGGKETVISYLQQLSKGNFLRTIERTTDSIALYMPDTLSFTHNQNYSTAEFGGSPLALLGAAAAGYSQFKDSSTMASDITKNLTPFIASRALQRFGGNAGLAVFAAASGTVINPQLELIYTSPSFREFRFDFMLYPRSSKEAKEVQSILNRLRFHQAPELLGSSSAGGLGGFFLVPPSEFDIKFYYNGRENPNIPQISTCILTSIDTDYAPNGWSAYEVPSEAGVPSMGGTGMPVGIRLSLTFQETEIMTKSNFSKLAYENGFGER